MNHAEALKIKAQGLPLNFKDPRSLEWEIAERFLEGYEQGDRSGYERGVRASAKVIEVLMKHPKYLDAVVCKQAIQDILTSWK